ncbi:MAG: glycosyltransferase family 2 protein [Mycobacterium sp.]
MKTAVITAVHGRGTHLRRQLAGLECSSRPTDLHIVVAIDDPEVRNIVTATGSAALVIGCNSADGPLPVARARNLGAEAALQAGAELLVFLDVDCIPAVALIERYHRAAGLPGHAWALLCGPVTYLEPSGPPGYVLDTLERQVNPHPARPAPAADEIVVSTDYALFWSLSFAVTPATWHRIGGFCERYRGYGGEDTDFAQCAAAAGVGMRWVGGAHAFHQHHPVSDPPVEHVDDIVRNGAIFHERWGWWPMTGWLNAFEDLGLIERDPCGRPRRVSRAIRG